MEKRLSKDEVLHYFGISRSTLYRWINLGYIASPVRFGTKSYWYAESIEKTDRFFRRRAEKNMLQEARK